MRTMTEHVVITLFSINQSILFTLYFVINIDIPCSLSYLLGGDVADASRTERPVPTTDGIGGGTG